MGHRSGAVFGLFMALRACRGPTHQPINKSKAEPTVSPHQIYDVHILLLLLLLLLLLSSSSSLLVGFSPDHGASINRLQPLSVPPVLIHLMLDALNVKMKSTLLPQKVYVQCSSKVAISPLRARLHRLSVQEEKYCLDGQTLTSLSNCILQLHRCNRINS